MVQTKKVNPYNDENSDSDTSVSNSTQSNGSVQLEGVTNVKGLSNSADKNKVKENTEVPAEVFSNFGVKSTNHSSIVLTSKNLLIVVRNSEHMNKCFPEWLTHNYVDGKYKTTDMNQPKKMHVRDSAQVNFGMDPPLTVFGGRLGALLGKDLVANNVVISAVYSSPALRCVETALRILESQSKKELKIRIEPALFEFNATKPFPVFMTKDELVENNFPIDDAYDPVMTVEYMKSTVNNESSMAFAKRCQETFQAIIKLEKPLGVVLIVTHAVTLHVSARVLTGRSLKRKGAAVFPTASTKEIDNTTPNYPFCSMIALRPTPILENATTAAVSKYIGGEKFHILGGDGITPNIEEAQFGQVAGLMPSFNSTCFSTRFDHAWFMHPS